MHIAFIRVRVNRQLTNQQSVRLLFCLTGSKLKNKINAAERGGGGQADRDRDTGRDRQTDVLTVSLFDRL